MYYKVTYQYLSVSSHPVHRNLCNERDRFPASMRASLTCRYTLEKRRPKWMVVHERHV
jgi:hypothetical protein